MSLRTLPEIAPLVVPAEIDGMPPVEALEKWDGGIRAAASDANTVDIFGIIGLPQASGDGIAEKDVATALRRMSGPVTVNINSPGGRYDHGVAIYSLLRAYPGQVNVRVLGQAGSAASVAAMAGDEIAVAEAGMIMIHNASAIVDGNRSVLAQAAAFLEGIDSAMGAIYAARTGRPVAEIAQMMDKTTFMMGREAVAKGFATGMLAPTALREDRQARAKGDHLVSLQVMESALAAIGKTRAERRAFIKEITGITPSAEARNAMPSAGLAGVADDLRRLVATLP